MTESFKPIAHTPPDGFLNSLKFFVRLLIDFQVLTVYRELKKFIKKKNGTVLDLGCGASPYRHLLSPQFEYTGIDHFDSASFGYNTDVLKFDGVNIPFQENSIGTIICTEVLEHTQRPQELVDDMFRVLQKEGTAFITIPWSARFHYIPYDYYRFTPYMLKIIFKKFSEIEILPRGTDITVIASKIILIFARQFSGGFLRKIIAFPFVLILSPCLLILVIIGHLSLLLNIGSTNDPLGYTIKLKK